MSATTNSRRIYFLERMMAALGAAVCLILTAVIWVSVSRQQEMWPLPALYLLEMAAASLLGLLGVLRADVPGNLLAWAVAGALLGFAIMPGSSIGFFYLPVAVLLGLAALWQSRQAWRRLPLHLGIALAAAVAQVALMLALIQLLYPVDAIITHYAGP